MENQTPAAPAPAGESVANTPTDTNTNTTVEAPKTDAPATPANGSVDLHGFTPEQLGEMKKFFDNNGGFEKVKSKISNPEKPVEKPAEPQTTQAPQATQPIQQNANIPEGAMSYNEILMRDHFKMLAEEEKYAGIKDEIVQGKVFSEMTDMGMKPFLDNGMIDMKNILKFLDLKAKGAPAPQTSVTPEASPAPTANYTPVGENIASREEALKVLQESAIAAQSGSAPHPAYEKAKAFLKEHPLGSK